MIRSLIKTYPDSRIIVVFDAKGPTFRNEMYSEYKANRPPMPDDLRVQIQPIHDLVDAMGLPRLVIEGVEADDVIGTLAVQAEAAKQPVIISTGDKDMAQLVDPHVSLLNTMTDTHMDMDGVVDKFGVRPDQIIDYLALVGDKVDNIPGVEKCGPKTAVKWLAAYDTLESVIEHADEIKGKIGENLRAAIEHLPLSKALATIRTDIDLPFALNDLDAQQANEEQLRALYTELEFKSWISEVSDTDDSIEETSNEPEIETHYEVLTTKQSVNDWIKRIKTAKCFAVDTETTSVKYKEAELVGISLAVEPGEAVYIPVAHQPECIEKQLDRDWVLEKLKPVLENTKIQKIGQHIKYDAHIFERYGIEVKGMAFDTMLESYVLNSTATRHDMDSLAAYYLDHETITFEAIAGKGAKQKTFDQISIDEAAPYACEDADITIKLHQKLWAKLEETPRLKTLFETLERPLIPVLQKMESTGALIDPQFLGDLSEELADKMATLEAEAYELAGETFNLGSPKQLQAIFYEKLGMPVLKKTPKGQPSTAEAVLHDLAMDYELPAVILEYRGLSKLKSTYTDPLPAMINSETGRIHTSYHQAVTATGRLSSSDPNLQNIPIRSEQGRKIRQAFIAPKGSVLIAADYSQIELRIMAHLSGDRGLLDAFANDLDVHKATAAEIFGVALDEVSGEQRRKAKAINFGLIYGMSAFGLARQIDVSRGAAQSYIDRYFERYPGVQDYMERARKEAAEQGYVETLFGRRLYVPEINARNMARRQAAERTAINAPMQGTAADIIKAAMIAVDQWLTKEHPNAHLLMQVHDELIVECPKKDAKIIQAGLVKAMSEAAKLDVPLLVEAGVGQSWGDAHGL